MWRWRATSLAPVCQLRCCSLDGDALALALFSAPRRVAGALAPRRLKHRVGAFPPLAQLRAHVPVRAGSLCRCQLVRSRGRGVPPAAVARAKGRGPACDRSVPVRTLQLRKEPKRSVSSCWRAPRSTPQTPAAARLEVAHVGYDARLGHGALALRHRPLREAARRSEKCPRLRVRSCLCMRRHAAPRRAGRTRAPPAAWTGL